MTTLPQHRWMILISAVVSFFAVAVTFFAVAPLIPDLTRTFGLSHFEIGLLVGAIAVPAIFLSVPLGLAVDRWPPRAAGVVGLAVMIAGAAVFAAAPNYPALLAGRFLFGIGGLVMNLLLAQLLTVAFSGRQLALAMGIFMAVYPAGMITIFSAHTPLAAHLGWRGELVVLAALAAVALPLHVLAVPRRGDLETPADTPREPKRRERWLSGSLVALAVSWMLFFAAYAAVPTFAPQWIGRGPSALLTVTIIVWVSLVLSPVAGALIDRVGRPGLWVVGGLALFAATLGLMAVGAVAEAVAMALVGVSLSAVTTATYALPGALVPESRVGLAFGFITAFSNFGTVWGPAAAGAILDAFADWFLMWVVLAAVAGLGAFAAAFVRPRRA